MPTSMRPAAIAAWIVLVSPSIARADDDDCVDHPVVGVDECHHFGSTWKAGGYRGFDYSIGASVHRFPNRSLSVNAPDDTSSPLPLDAVSDRNAYVVDIASNVFLHGPLYTGWGASLGGMGVHTTSGTYDANGKPTTYRTSGRAFSAALWTVLGVDALQLERATLRFEVRGGLESASFGLDEPTGCPDENDDPGPCGASALWGFVEPRAIVEWWLTPWVSANLWAGYDVIPAHAGSGGFAFAYHLLPYDSRP